MLIETMMFLLYTYIIIFKSTHIYIYLHTIHYVYIYICVYFLGVCVYAQYPPDVCVFVAAIGMSLYVTSGRRDSTPTPWPKIFDRLGRNPQKDRGVSENG